MEDKYVGVVLALCSTVFNGTSFVLKKKGLMTSEGHGTASSYACLYNPIWWAGTVLMGLGEFANFAAYTFAPAILVTPLGALSVVISAVLAALFLNERLDRAGKIGCGLCMIGSTIIVLHAPPEKNITSVDEIVQFIIQPQFLAYVTATLAYLVIAYVRLAPKYGRRYMLVYISMCSLGGSLLVIACKGLGMAIKLSLSGSNQMANPTTYVFLVVVVICVVFQLNYLNRALDLFPAGAVSPVYYVCFTVATIVATLILFQGTESISALETVNVMFGFAVMVFGVFLLHTPAVLAAAGAAPQADAAFDSAQSLPLTDLQGRTETAQQTPDEKDHLDATGGPTDRDSLLP